ncbi:PREDICTED: protein WVD2-like 4 [Tarenaya hassleriana]|uniref:protein WVD2-like 4 n=1 Tax=Tarenaya hassleriana TaxID=28532 RepID=UPI00053C5E78|nr:PREDICTED: protein WVD2-like 4 [Tarenaya hassleriana]XP_010541819.1 PREDICTED: protein WVD2-like 4 [Tarenaya hassleriana]XP_010541820.1 PREDICTED: protein WVD2-like 4 [Tarenaya hassleriana]
MASEKGIAVEDESVITEMNTEEQPVLESKKEEANVYESGKNPNEPENLELSGKKVENMDENVPEAKISKPVMETSNQDSGTSKKSKMAKEKAVPKHQGTFSRSPRFLSQSLSFPSRGPHAAITRKSIGAASKTTVKSVLVNGPNPKVAASPRSNVSTKRTSLVSTLHKKQITPAKPGSEDAALDPTSEVSKSGDKDSKPVKGEMPSKDDEDTRSTTTSTSTPRGRRSIGSASGFSFRLEERAEKRKEFYTKLEEKIHAKEIEKSNLQAKSKENQEAEIKKLRKRLTFKASPMPSFYKEPPPKVELKKIPTTRPVSPKLGRKKGNVDTVGGEAGSCASPRVSLENISSGKGMLKQKDSSILEKPVTKSQPKLQTREISDSDKIEKPLKPKPKKTEPRKHAKKEETKKADENLNSVSDTLIQENEETAKEEQNSSTSDVPNKIEKLNLNIPKAEIITSEVVAGG